MFLFAFVYVMDMRMVAFEEEKTAIFYFRIPRFQRH